MATDMDVNTEEHDPLPLKKASTPEWQRPYISPVNQLQVPVRRPSAVLLVRRVLCWLVTECRVPPNRSKSRQTVPAAAYLCFPSVTMQAVIGLLLVMALSCAPGIIQWLTVLRHDHHIGFSFIISLWTGHGLIAVTGVLGYFTMMPLLLTLHAATTAVTGAAMVVNYSMIYFSAEMRCTFLQIGTRGCSDCPCAIDDTCQAVRFSGKLCQYIANQPKLWCILHQAACLHFGSLDEIPYLCTHNLTAIHGQLQCAASTFAHRHSFKPTHCSRNMQPALRMHPCHNLARD